LNSYKSLLIPINIKNNHWALVSINLKEYTMIYYDSSYSEINNGYIIMQTISELFTTYLLEEKNNKILNSKSTSIDSSLKKSNYDENTFIEQESSDGSTNNKDNGRIEINWKYKILNVPQQNNLSDCGVFLCKYMEYITREESFNFTYNDIEYFRILITAELINGKLLTE
jgi:Ulp1 family protease